MNTVGIYLSFLRSGFDWAPDRYFLYSAERFRLRQVARHQAQKGRIKIVLRLAFLALLSLLTSLLPLMGHFSGHVIDALSRRAAAPDQVYSFSQPCIYFVFIHLFA